MGGGALSVVARQRELANLDLPALSGEGEGADPNEGDSPDHGAELRERLVQKLQKLQKLRKRLVREEIMPDPAKRAAWILINGPEEIDAIEKEDAERGSPDNSEPSPGNTSRHPGLGDGSAPSLDGAACRHGSTFLPSAEKPSPPPRAVPRIINMNDPDAYERLCPREDRPWIPAGSLPREPRWPRRESPVQGSGGGEEEAQQAFKEWEAHVDAGRVGPKKPD